MIRRAFSSIALITILYTGLPSAEADDFFGNGAPSDVPRAIATKTLRPPAYAPDFLEHDGLASRRARSDAALVVHRNFLLFDFKQNLRHWPVLAEDISRSPPLLTAV